MKTVKTMKLEKAVEEIESQYKKNISKRHITINDLAIEIALNMSLSLRSDIKQEEIRYSISKNLLGRKLSNVHNVLQILHGSRGFLRCPQGWNNLRPCFDAIQDIIKDINQSMVDIFLEEPNCGFGMEVWEIDDRGMMNLINCERDTSD